MRIAADKYTPTRTCLSRDTVNSRGLKALRVVRESQIRKLPTQLSYDGARPVRAAAVSHNQLYRTKTLIALQERADTIRDMLSFVQSRDDSQYLFTPDAACRLRASERLSRAQDRPTHVMRQKRFPIGAGSGLRPHRYVGCDLGRICCSAAVIGEDAPQRCFTAPCAPVPVGAAPETIIGWGFMKRLFRHERRHKA